MTDWREMVSDEAMPLGFQQGPEVPATTDDESWTHSGCGGTVVFDLSGGFCTRCHAENLDHEIGEVVRDTEPLVHGDCGMDVVPLDAHHGAGSWPPMVTPGEGCER